MSIYKTSQDVHIYTYNCKFRKSSHRDDMGAEHYYYTHAHTHAPASDVFDDAFRHSYTSSVTLTSAMTFSDIVTQG